MEIKKKMQDAINRQINRELYSAYLYLSMSAYFESLNLKGFAHWMRKQAEEETKHAMKFFGYVVERGGRVTVAAIEAPPSSWKNPQNAFEDVYAHEMKVTELINDLVGLAESENDRATEVELSWFIKEQVEEEDSANEILQKLRMVGENKPALLMLDAELGKRA